MSNQRVQIVLGVKGDSADFAKLKSQFTEFGAWIKGAIGLNVGNDIYQSLKRIVTIGIEFNAQLETAQLGLAAILRTFQPQYFTTFDRAMTGSAALIDDLKTAALSTVASFDELLKSYQSIAGAAFAAGVPLEKHVQLTAMLAQATSGLGLPGNQIAQESRALLTGNIGPDALLAKSLGITKQMIDQARAQGRMFEFLQGRLGAFTEAGSRAASTLSGRLSNLKDALMQLGGEATLGLFEQLKGFLKDLTTLVNSESFQKAIKAVGIGAAIVTATTQTRGATSGLFSNTTTAAAGAMWWLSRWRRNWAETFGEQGDMTSPSLFSARNRPLQRTLPNVTSPEGLPSPGSWRDRIDFSPLIQTLARAATNVQAPEGLARSGLYTSFGAAVMAKEGMTLQRELVRETVRQTEILRRTEFVLRNAL